MKNLKGMDELKDIYDFYIDDDDSCDEEIKTDDFIEMQKQQYVTLARQLSETAKTKTCIEIHPAATIGHNFVVDHGIGTVIGETCEIGDNCYILQGVVLGALGISSNLSGKRHPTLKDNVEIGAFSRVLGPVTIGENSIINSYCIIISDLPPNSKVSITNQLQITSSKTHSSERPSIYGVVPTDSVLNIYGKNMFMVRKIELIEYDYTLNNTNNSMFLGNCTYNIVSDDRIELKLVDNKQLKSASFKDLAIIIYYKINCNMNYTVITNSRGVYDYVKNQIS